MSDVYADAIRYGVIKFGKVNEALATLLHGDSSYDEDLVGEMYASTLSEIFVLPEMKNVEIEELINAGGIYLLANNLRIAIECQMEANDIDHYLNEAITAFLNDNPNILEMERAVAGIHMALLGSGWDIMSYYTEFDENGTPSKVTIEIRSSIEIDEDEIVYIGMNATRIVPEEENFITLINEIKDLVKEKLEGAKKYGQKGFVKKWRILMQKLEQAC